MTRTSTFRARMMAGERMTGTFLKTPAPELVEVLALAGLDVLCLDAEHAPFGRREMDLCLAMGRAHDLPMLVRVPEATPGAILHALDSGAVGIVVPHVDGPERAAELARAAHFGLYGRGYAGSTRWAGWATRGMGEVRAQDAETALIAQIEEPAGVEHAAAIAGTDGIDALFVGPADLAVGYGLDAITDPKIDAAYDAVASAAADAGKATWTWVPNAEAAAKRAAQGVAGFLVSSEHGWMLQGAKAARAAIAGI